MTNNTVILCGGCRLLTIADRDNDPRRPCPACGGQRTIYGQQQAEAARRRPRSGRGAVIAASIMQQVFSWVWFTVLMAVMVLAAVLAGLAGAL